MMACHEILWAHTQKMMNKVDKVELKHFAR